MKNITLPLLAAVLFTPICLRASIIDSVSAKLSEESTASSAEGSVMEARDVFGEHDGSEASVESTLPTALATKAPLPLGPAPKAKSPILKTATMAPAPAMSVPEPSLDTAVAVAAGAGVGAGIAALAGGAVVVGLLAGGLLGLAIVALMGW